MGVSIKEAARAMQAFKKGIPVAVLRGLRKGMPLAVRAAKTEYMERKDNRHPIKVFDPPNPPPGPLGIRQGNLARTVRVGEMRYTGGRVIASLAAGSAAVPYAKVHEFGMTIKAKNGPNLIFPVGFPGGFAIARVPSVTIPARPFLRPALDDTTPQIIEHVQKELQTLARATLRGVARF